MKKKGFRLLLIALVLMLVACTFLTSCVFIRENEERVANQIMASVRMEYNGQTLELVITRNELLSYVNYIISLYSQYGMSYDVKQLIDLGLDSLINQKHNILNGMVYLMSLEHRKAAAYSLTPEYIALYGTKITAEGVLTQAERLDAIRTTNKSFSDAIKETKEAEEKAAKESEASSAKDTVANYFADGYTVKKGSPSVARKAVEGDENYDAKKTTYVTSDKGELYQTAFIADSSKTVEPDYQQVFIRLIFEKAGQTDKEEFLPISESALSTEEVSDAPFISNNIKTKKAIVKYEEPYKTDSGEDAYRTHNAETEFLLVTPRTAKEEEKDDDIDEDTGLWKLLKEYRYADLKALLKSDNEDTVKDMEKMFEMGAIFDVFAPKGASDAEKDAYSTFRGNQAKKKIGFDANNAKTDPYSSLGYYYISAFESAILTAVQYELKQAAISETWKSDLDRQNAIKAEYAIKVIKQKEEYDSLSPMEQVKKFAETIKTDLSTCYYVPLLALSTQSYEYTTSKEKAVTDYKVEFNTSNGTWEYTVWELNKDGTINKDKKVPVKDNGDGTFTIKRNYATYNADGSYTIDMFYIAHVLFKWDTDLTDAMKEYLRDRTEEEQRTIREFFISLLYTNESNPDFIKNGGDKLEDAFMVDDAGEILKKKVLEQVLIQELYKQIKDGELNLENFKALMVKYNDDGGAMRNALGYIIALGDISHGYDGDDFPNKAKDLYLSLLSNNVPVNGGLDPETGKPLGANAVTNWAFTSYGLHIEYISFAPFYMLTLQNVGTDLNPVWALPFDMNRDLDATKIETSIQKELETKMGEKAYSAWTKEMTEKLDANPSVKTKYPKRLKQLIKDLGLK